MLEYHVIEKKEVRILIVRLEKNEYISIYMESEKVGLENTRRRCREI